MIRKKTKKRGTGMAKAIELEWVTASSFRIANQTIPPALFLPARIKVGKGAYMRVASASGPGIYLDFSRAGIKTHVLCVRGYSLAKDGDVVAVPAVLVDSVKTAVDRYNELIADGVVYVFSDDGACEKRTYTSRVWVGNRHVTVAGLGEVRVTNGFDSCQQVGYFSSQSENCPMQHMRNGLPVVTLTSEPPPFWVVKEAGPNCAVPSRVLVKSVIAGSTVFYFCNDYYMCKHRKLWEEFESVPAMMAHVTRPRI
jgi:hypothetical protein